MNDVAINLQLSLSANKLLFSLPESPISFWRSALELVRTLKNYINLE